MLEYDSYNYYLQLYHTVHSWPKYVVDTLKEGKYDNHHVITTLFNQGVSKK